MGEPPVDGLLFLCVANSARSQMAEGIARALAPHRAIFSAGSAPGTLHPTAVAVCAEIGVDLTGHHAKSIPEVPADQIGTAITLCAEQVCPVFPHAVERLHWPVDDPAGVGADGAARLAAFRVARDAIRTRLEAWLGAKLPPRVA